MRTCPVSASKAVADPSTAADVEIHSDAVDKLVLSDEDFMDSGTVLQQKAPDKAILVVK